VRRISTTDYLKETKNKTVEVTTNNNNFSAGIQNDSNTTDIIFVDCGKISFSYISSTIKCLSERYALFLTINIITGANQIP
jgi:hypothetical protein